MKITESKIRQYIRQSLFEMIKLPDPKSLPNQLKLPSSDKIQLTAYKLLMSGKSIEEIFPDHDREELNNKIKLLYNYIKEKHLPMPKIVGGTDEFGWHDEHARLESATVNQSAIIEVLADFAKTNALEIPDKAIDESYASMSFEFDNYALWSSTKEEEQKLQAIKKEFESLPKTKQRYNVKTALATLFLYLRKDIANENSELRKDINQAYLKYKNSPTGSIQEAVSMFLHNYYEKAYKDSLDKKDLGFYYFAIANKIMTILLTRYDIERLWKITSLVQRLSKLASDIEKKATNKLVGKQRKIMKQLKNVATEQIKGDTANWFAVHYPGAFSSVGQEGTYLETLTSFIENFGGPEGINSDEYAAVPYPKSAKKLHDSLARGTSGSMQGLPKIGMMLNGTITGIYSADVHSDTFAGFKNYKSGIGQLDEIDPEEGFVRFPGGEQISKRERKKAATKFKKYDEFVVLDLEKAENDIANSDVYPSHSGYYECFIDDWYVEGIVCDWEEFMKNFPAESLAGPEAIMYLVNFLKIIKEKNIKIYDKNFSTNMIGGFNGLVDMFQLMLDQKGIMKFSEGPGGKLIGPLDKLKKQLGEK